MPKYLILHNADEGARDFMAHFTKEEMQAGMAEWIAWKTEAEKTVKFEFGMPLQSTTLVTQNGTEKSTTKVSGYSIVEADSEEVAFAALRNHPHLKRSGATLDVLEMVSMPGM